MWEVEEDRTRYLNKEFVKCQMLNDMKGNVGRDVAFSIILFVYIVGGIFCGSFAWSNTGDIGGIFAKILIYGILVLLTIISPLILALFLVQNLRALLKKRQKLQNMAFDIVEDTLVNIIIEDPVIRSTGSKTYIPEKRVFYFAKAGRYVTSPKDGSAFDYASEGDKFYLVIFHGGSYPVMVYNQKVYTYRE